MFVSHKRQKNSNCRFGFVHFKKLDEAKKAVKNLNEVKIRDNFLKVSFAKYEKKGKPWNGPFLQKGGCKSDGESKETYDSYG